MHFALVGLAVAIQIANPQRPAAAAATGPISDSVGLGSCRGPAGNLELREVMFLENRTLDTEIRDARVRVNLRNQTVEIDTLPLGADSTRYFLDIGGAVARDGRDADVDLKIGLLSGAPVIYWRETYQHHRYRQGLYAVEGPGLRPLCEGMAGTDSLG